MRSQDIQIPEPCHADWATMRPEEKGRFCFECSKKVHDLSAMTKPEAQEFLRGAGCADVCVSFEHHPDGTLLFREPTPARVVPIARLRRPRSVAAVVAGVGMAAALAACAPHGDATVRSYSAETPVFQAERVVIPHGGQEASPVPPPEEKVAVEDEPCEPAVTEGTGQSIREPDHSRVRGRIKRTAGKPVLRTKGDMAGVDPSAL